APDGSIALQSRPFVPFVKRHRLLGLPIVRGGASLAEALIVGTQALNWSAAVQERPGAAAAPEPPAPAKPPPPRTPLKENLGLTLTLAASFALALGLFQLLPYAVAALVTGGSRENPVNPLLFNGTAGAVRMALLIAYLWGLSFLPDVRRLFQYHGAEH